MKQFLIMIIILSFCYIPFIAQAQEETTTEGIQVIDAKPGKNIQDRAIVNEDTSFALNASVFVWMKIEGAASDAVTVTWKCGDQTLATTIGIGGSPWRTWAARTVRKAGDWTVTISDSKGTTSKELSFTVK